MSRKSNMLMSALLSCALGTMALLSTAMPSVSVAAKPGGGSTESYDGCTGTTDDPCLRTGFCFVQNSAWDASLWISRSDGYNRFRWTGLCDQQHVALVQGNCSPLDSSVDITVYLSGSSNGQIPAINGTLYCGGDTNTDGGGSKGGGKPK